MTANTRYSKTAYLALCGLFAALTAICSYINIPLGFTPIPMNLATLAVFLSGGLLGKKYGPLSIGVYVLMGAAGVPVFAGFQAGIGVLAGPTGGFLIGYILASFIVGLCLDKGFGATSARASSKGKRSSKGQFALCIGGMVGGLLCCYALGTLWFAYITNTGIIAALVSCVLPFVLLDAIKIVVSSFLIIRLRPILQ